MYLPPAPFILLSQHPPATDNNKKRKSDFQYDRMTSLAVLPVLKKTVTDLMDEDLYQVPSTPAYEKAAAPSPAVYGATASNVLSNLLNIPDSFVENYTRLNGSNPSLGSAASSLNLESSDYSAYNEDHCSPKSNPFSTYANPELQLQQQSQLQQPQLPAYVQPEQLRATMPYARRGRIFTLDQHEIGKQNKDEDYYLFNTDIQPSQLMTNRNYFNTEDYLDNSMFIMNGDLDAPKNASGLPAVPVAGFENDYFAMDNFMEDAEDLSEDSDDDNYFQDESDEFDDLIANADFGDKMTSNDSFMPLNMPSVESEIAYDGSKLETMGEMNLESELSRASTDEDLMADNVEPSPVTVEKMPLTHVPEDYFRSAAEITATNPNHQCELINPSSGQPCNKQFSRPYDLIRHQETIHASKKKIFRCVICEGRYNGGSGNGKLKTFSRGDALSRHIKVKHGLGGQEAVDLINQAKENVEYVLY